MMADDNFLAAPADDGASDQASSKMSQNDEVIDNAATE